MRKTAIIILLSTILCFGLFSFVACSNSDNEINTIKDIEFYSEMKAGGDKIDVDFNNGKKNGFQFSIDEESDIREIVDLVLTAKLTNIVNDAPAPMGNISFTIHQGTNSYGISLNGIVIDNSSRYILSTNDELREKINAIATEKGAFDTEVGLIYKVIDINDIERVNEDKINIDDNTALLNLLHSDYADCEYFYLFDNENSAERYYTTGIVENELTTNQYKANIKIGKGKLVVMWHIFQNYNSTSYYLTRPSLSEINLGNTTSYNEFTFGLWHNYYLTVFYI